MSFRTLLRQIIFIFLLCGLYPNSALAGKIKPFKTGSINEIRAAHAGTAFIISLWSIDCPPCYKEMETWLQLSQQYPSLNIILVSTDDIELQTDVIATTKRLGVNHFESWQFAEKNTERLRFEIDSKWYGELPRTYFVNAKGESKGVSGVIDYQKLSDWANQQYPFNPLTGTVGETIISNNVESIKNNTTPNQGR